jgi:AbrB family looped-hinge helix DNA binding protein
MSFVKVQHKGQMTIPSAIRSAVGLADGDLVEVKAARGRIVLIPQVVMDRSKFPSAAGEYTPSQRRAMDARLKAAEKTPLHGPFKDGKEIAAYLKTFKKAQRGAKPKLQTRG